MIQLFTADGTTFEIDEEIARKSLMISDLLDEVGADDPIPIPNVDSAIMKLIIRYCEYHSFTHTIEEFDTFDRDFFEDIRSCTQLLEIVSAANFLNIPELLDKSTDAVADLLRGKTPENIREILGVSGEYTEEEKAEVMRENKWAFPENRIFYP